MNFLKSLDDIIVEFSKKNIDFAIMGGHALQFWGAVRMTIDLDLVIYLKERESADMTMKSLGYKLLYGTENIANYVSDDPEKGRIDFLFAHRKYAVNMMERAIVTDLSGRKIKVLRPEDIIGLKVQAIANDPSRTHKDLADIENLIKANKLTMDMELIKEYFQLFDMSPVLTELMERLK